MSVKSPFRRSDPVSGLLLDHARRLVRRQRWPVWKRCRREGRSGSCDVRDMNLPYGPRQAEKFGIAFDLGEPLRIREFEISEALLDIGFFRGSISDEILRRR